MQVNFQRFPRATVVAVFGRCQALRVSVLGNFDLLGDKTFESISMLYRIYSMYK